MSDIVRNTFPSQVKQVKHLLLPETKPFNTLHVYYFLTHDYCKHSVTLHI